MIYSEHEVIYNNGLRGFDIEHPQLFISYGPRGSAKHQAIFGNNGMLVQLARSLKMKYAQEKKSLKKGLDNSFIRADWISNSSVITCFKKSKRKDAPAADGWIALTNLDNDFNSKVQQIIDRDDDEIDEAQNISGLL